MTPSILNTQTSQRAPYTDHSQDYIPKTTPWDDRLTCSYQQARNTSLKKTCCSDTKTIDRVIDKAYLHGVQSHLGIAAIQDYPCITGSEISKLSNDLQKAIKRHGIQMNMPQDIDLAYRPGGAQRSTMQYCKEVIFERLSRELGKVVGAEPLAFSREVLNYCQNILTIPMRSNDPSHYTKFQ